MSKEQQLISIVNLIAKIPWGEARTPETVLQKGKGTCQGKHLLLQACLDELRIKYKPVVCTFYYSEQGLKLPPNLIKIIKEGEWIHGHNFLKIQNFEGKFVDIDITWNRELKPYGFLCSPVNWDGKKPIIGMKKIVKRWDGINVEKIKSEIINSLNPELKERRHRFVKELVAWVEGINKELIKSSKLSS